MTASRGDDDEDPAQDALNWLIVLNERPEAPELRARFDAWLAASPAHRAAWEEACRVWVLLGEAGAAERPRGVRSRSSRRNPRRRRLVLAGAGVALAGCLLALLLPAVSLQLQADFVTAVGETREVSLPDGSRLHLGGDSAVAVDYSAEARVVRLMAGSVFAEVAAEGRRFTVIADGLESSALGTAYEVRRLDSGTFVAVARGSVGAEDRRTALAERLNAGDWLHVARDGSGSRRGTARADQVAAWRDGHLAVKDWPLGDVADALRHHFRGAIIVLDDALAGRRVTGIYDLDDPAGALRAAAYPAGGRVRAVTPWVLVVSAR